MSSSSFKPTFNGRLRIARTFLSTCVFPAIPVLIFGLQVTIFEIPYLPALVLTILILLGINLLSYFITRAAYNQYLFELKDDVIAQRSTFFATTVKEINYMNIKELGIVKGPLQRKFGLGSIVIHTQASSGSGNSSSGMTLFDLPNVEEIFQLIKTRMAEKQ